MIEILLIIICLLLGIAVFKLSKIYDDLYSKQRDILNELGFIKNRVQWIDEKATRLQEFSDGLSNREKESFRRLAIDISERMERLDKMAVRVVNKYMEQ